MSKRKKKVQSQSFNLQSLPKQLQHINLNAAGIDIGSEHHMVAVPEGRAEVAVRHVKNVTGRKSDILDCQWIQQLHTYGLLAGAFRPADEICVLRSYLRQREMLTQTASMHIQHMQKALQQMNLLLHNVVSDITGVTGMKIIKELLAGERDPRVLASNRNKQCHNDRATIAKSLVGNYREEHLFALRQAVDLYEIYQTKIGDCDEAIVKQLSAQPDVKDEPPPPGQKLTPARDRQRGGVNVRDLLFKKSGVDLFAIPGLGADTLLVLTSEVGFDLSPWKTVKHFSSWLSLCPGTKISGGKVLSRKVKRNPNRAAQAFRMAAATLARSQSALGAFYRRVKSRTGGKQAITATAHKIARIYYALLTQGTTYVEMGQKAYEQRYQERRLKHLTTQAKSLGFQLVPSTT